MIISFVQTHKNLTQKVTLLLNANNTMKTMQEKNKEKQLKTRKQKKK